MTIFIVKMERFHLEGDFELSVSLFVNVSNSEELKKMAISGEINAALLSPSMVVRLCQCSNQSLNITQSHSGAKEIRDLQIGLGSDRK